MQKRTGIETVMPKLFDDLQEGFNQAINYAEGKCYVRLVTYTIEPVVEYRAKYREELANYTIKGCFKNCVKVNNTPYNASDGNIFCEDTNAQVIVHNKNISGTTIATYTKATGKWTYNL
jgi:hypothetical protein